MLQSLSDSWLTFLGATLQIVAIAGTSLGLVSAIGTLLISNESSIRNEKRTKALEQRVATRTEILSGTNREKFIEGLAKIPKAKIGFILVTFDNETNEFGKLLPTLFSGWETQAEPFDGQWIPPKFGIIFNTHKPDNSTAKQIADLLIDCGFDKGEISFHTINTAPDGVVVITIAPRQR
jgi:hypothetical protein